MYKGRDWVFLRKGEGNAGEGSDSSVSTSSSEDGDVVAEESLDTQDDRPSEDSSEPSTAGEEGKEDEGLTAEDEALLMRRLEDISKSDVDEDAGSSDALDSGEEEEEALLIEQIGYVFPHEREEADFSFWCIWLMFVLLISQKVVQ